MALINVKNDSTSIRIQSQQLKLYKEFNTQKVIEAENNGDKE